MGLGSEVAINKDKDPPEDSTVCAKAGTFMVYLRNGKEMGMAGRGSWGRVQQELVPMCPMAGWGLPRPWPGRPCLLIHHFLPGVRHKGVVPGTVLTTGEVEMGRGHLGPTLSPGFISPASPSPPLRLQSCFSVPETSVLCAACLSSLPSLSRIFSPSKNLCPLGLHRWVAYCLFLPRLSVLHSVTAWEGSPWSSVGKGLQSPGDDWGLG